MPDSQAGVVVAAVPPASTERFAKFRLYGLTVASLAVLQRQKSSLRWRIWGRSCSIGSPDEMMWRIRFDLRDFLWGCLLRSWGMNVCSIDLFRCGDF